jgi:predicted metal-dependent hydrolase
MPSTSPAVPFGVQLSLFASEDSAVPAPAPRPLPQVGQPVAAPPVPPEPRPLPPGSLRGSRSVRLGQIDVPYELRRARRRSIGFSIGPEGLAVSAPRWVSLGEIETALKDKGGWILRKLHEQHERARRAQAARVQWRDGTTLPYLGEPLVLVIDPRQTEPVLNTRGEALPGVPRLALHLPLPQWAAPEQLRDAVQSWLQRQARALFEQRCAHFAERLGVRVRRISLSSAQTRWGSASHDGTIRLNWRLVHLAPTMVDYVVAHELAHLREMNHSPAFWDVVRAVLPGFEQLRDSLRHEVLPGLE